MVTNVQVSCTSLFLLLLLAHIIFTHCRLLQIYLYNILRFGHKVNE